MGPGGIATIIASCSLLIIAVATGYVIVRLGRLIDEAKITLKAFTDETAPLIKESTRTVELVNGPLESINRITKNVESVSDKIAGATDNFVSKGGPAVKALGLIASAASATKKRGKNK
jgi:uncharacterized protein YoxC